MRRVQRGLRLLTLLLLLLALGLDGEETMLLEQVLGLLGLSQ